MGYGGESCAIAMEDGGKFERDHSWYYVDGWVSRHFRNLLIVLRPDDRSRIARPHPPIIRALQTAKDTLQAAGVKVVDWEPYKSMEMLEIIVSQ